MPSRWRRLAAVVLGVGLTTFGLALTVVPSVTDRPPVAAIADSLAGLDRAQAVLLASLFAVGYVLLLVWVRGRDIQADEPSEGPFDRAQRAPPEQPTTDTARQMAAGIDARIEAATQTDGDGETVADLREPLAATATAVYAARTDSSPATAKAAVEAGEWTDDEAAAAFLAGETVPSPGARLRLWLAPERERRRRIERTVTAIERLHDDV